MAEDTQPVNKVIAIVIGIAIIAFVILVLAIIFNSIPLSSISSTSSLSNDFIYLGPEIYPAIIVDISSVKIYNSTWLNCDGDDDFINLSVSQSKATVSLWFKNETTGWTSVIQAGPDTYVNGVLDNTWGFLPYFINVNEINICKIDASTFLNLSIDEFRVYETALNSSEVTTVFEDGR